MYTLRQMERNDKIGEHLSLDVFASIYPPESVEALSEQYRADHEKKKRVRHFTGLSLVYCLLMMALWTRTSQARVWDKLTHGLALLQPGGWQEAVCASAVWYQRKKLGAKPLQKIFEQHCSPICTPQSKEAFYRGWRVMAVDGTLQKVADTPKNDAFFFRSSNQYGKGAYPQARCVFLMECGSHAIIDADVTDGKDSEMYGAYVLLRKIEAGMFLTHDSGLFAGGLWEQIRERKAHALCALAEPVLGKPLRRLSDGSYLTVLLPQSKAIRRQKKPLLIRVIEYQVTDERLGEAGKVYRLATTWLNPRSAPALELIQLYHERWEIELAIREIKTYQRLQLKVLRSKTPEGVMQELYALLLAHYAVRVLMYQSASEAGLDPDRLSFTEAVFQISETVGDLAMADPAQRGWLLARLLHYLRRRLLPPRRLRVNRREVKQVYNKYKPKKRDLPPPKPFGPDERFEDFVLLVCRPVATQQEATHEA
jgi:DDE family transposase/transposase IS4-like protein